MFENRYNLISSEFLSEDVLRHKQRGLSANTEANERKVGAKSHQYPLKARTFQLGRVVVRVHYGCLNVGGSRRNACVHVRLVFYLKDPLLSITRRALAALASHLPAHPCRSV